MIRDIAIEDPTISFRDIEEDLKIQIWLYIKTGNPDDLEKYQVHDKRQVSTCVGSLVKEGVVVSEIHESKGCSGNQDSTKTKNTMLILECYSCKQLLKDSNLTFTLTLKVNIC